MNSCLKCPQSLIRVFGAGSSARRTDYSLKLLCSQAASEAAGRDGRNTVENVVANSVGRSRPRSRAPSDGEQ